MQSLSFWKNWLTEYKWILYILMAVFIFSALFMWFSYFNGVDATIGWEKLQEQKVLETTVHSFNLGPFELTVPGESYVIFEYFNGGDFVPNTTASYLFLFVLMFSVAVILAVITTLERFWFFAGMTLFILFVASLKLEVLQVFGQRNIIPTIVVLFVFAGLAYYFKSFRSDTRFYVRLLSFLLLLGVATVLIVFFSDVSYPMLHVAVTAYVPGLIFAVLFIIMIAHEIFASFLYISGQSSKKSLRDFFIISLIWLINLVITYLHEIGSIHWNFVYINLYLLVSVSAVLGFWGFRHRESVYENIVSFHPFGSYFFLAFGAAAFAFVAHALGNANDAVLKVIRDVIIFSHLGFGVIFLLYFLSNFLGVAESNLSVYKVLYKPTRMPYFTFRLAGVIMVIAFVAYSNWREYVYHSMAGFYTSMGDLYGLLDQNIFTESYYTQASTYAFQSHHSNYILGKMKSASLNLEDAHYRYALANAKRPTDYSLVNDGNLFVWEQKLYKAIDAYRKAEDAVRNSGVVQNNAGFVYAKVSRLDSASFFLNEARKHNVTRESSETNFFAYAAIDDLPIRADSVVKLFETTAPGILANAIGLATLQHQPFEITVDPLQDKRLNLHSATLLNNYIIRNALTLDTTFTAQADRIISDPVNADFTESLKASLAFAYYHHGNVAKALEILAELVFITGEQEGKYNYIQGLWALEQESPEMAASYFGYARAYKYKKAKLYHAIALTEARKIRDAIIAWDTVINSGDDAERYIAASVKRILTLPVTDAAALSDEDKYQFCRYRLGVRDTTQFNRLINSFANSNYKAQALLDMSKKLFKGGNTISAIRYFNRISGLELTDRNLIDRARFFELEMLASRNEVFQLTQQINKGLSFDGSRTLEKLFYAALVNEASGDVEAAAKNYAIVGTYNPYYETGVLAAADFFRRQDAKSMKAYDLLAEAIQVNSTSIKLLTAYAREAARVGFDEYAASAAETVKGLLENN